MNRFILFLLLLTAFSYSTSTTACIVLPDNTINVGGPTTVCESNPNGSYNVSYSTGVDDPYLLFLAVQGGTVTNIQGYSSVGGVPSPGTCVPQLISSIVTGCNIDQVYEVAPGCRGGITFDVAWDDECPFGSNKIEAALDWGTAGIIDLVNPITIDPSCFTDPDEGGFSNMGNAPDVLDNPIAIDMDLKQTLAVDIFPNPATDSKVTISVPAAYKDYKVRITDMNGRLVQYYENVNERLEINTSEMGGSVYFVQVITADGITDTQKIILSK